MVGNRIAGESDKLLYGDYITVGDLIIDTPTRNQDGIREVVYYFMVKQWPDLRENATIWIDGEKLGDIDFIRFNNTARELEPWHISSATIKNIPHTKVVTGGLLCAGLKHLVIDGESHHFPGLTKWDLNRKFTSGYFGFHIKNKKQHGIYGAVLDGGTITLKGFEVQFGFSGVRLLAGKEDITIEGINISNFYIHDTVRGEGFYIGSTQAGAKAKLKNLKIKNGFISRTAAESIQVQHLIGGSEIENVIIRNAANDWLHAFQPYQDNGIQWILSSGVNTLRNVIVDCFAANGICPFGSDVNMEIAKDGHGYAENILFNDGRNTLMYLHKSASAGYNWHYKNIYLRGFNETYSKNTGEPIKPYYISKKHGTDSITFESIIHDGSKEKIFEYEPTLNIGEVTLDKTLPAPKYINSGFGTQPAHKINIWHSTYGKYFDGADGTPTVWEVDDIAIDARDDGNGAYRFCKCIEAHTTPLVDFLRPIDNPKFMLLSWDINGVRNDQPNWLASSEQSFFPPDDLRLADDCFWKNKGMGVLGIVEEKPVPEPEPDDEREDILDEYIINNIKYTVTAKGIYMQALIKK